ncbi:MAG: hypothetical protein JWP89_2326 [Schlesneria sp.]|nr:hypothetical protein [Schlesneria sp.]
MSSNVFQFDASDWMRKIQQRSGVASCVGAIVCVAMAVLIPSNFWPAYLVSVLFVIGISLGCLGLSLLHQLTGGQWGLEIARNLVAGTAAFPLAALLILPLILGAPHTYPWLDSARATELLNRHQQIYFEVWVWGGRAVIYLFVWGLLSRMVVRRYGVLCRTGAINRWCATPRLSSLGLIGLSLTTTFAMIDWVMSLEPRWTSTIFAAMLMMGFVVSGMAFVLMMQSLPNSLAGLPADAKSADARALDLGNLLMAFLLLWVYFAVSQFLIIWSGDLPIETTWYQRRLTGLWPGFGLLLVLFHFILPFGCLLSRDVKTSPMAVAFVTGDLLIMRLVDLVWTIIPACRVGGNWWMLCLPFALMTVCSAWFSIFLRLRNTLPPLRVESLASTSVSGLEVIAP